MDKLKPCPFCGSKNEKPIVIETGRIAHALRRCSYRVQCLDCGVMTLTKDEKQDAIKAWDTRAEKEGKS